MISSALKNSIGRLVKLLLFLLFVGTLLTAQVSAYPTAGSAVEDPPYESYLPAVYEPPEEWTFHKTADGQHPNGNEQQMMWLMNRARANPTQEGIWLATTTESDVARPRDYFNVNTTLLKSEFASYAAKPPAAFDVRLYNAAKAHSDFLISIDGQEHTDQFQRVRDAGFSYTSIRGNVFSYAKTALYGHAGFNIDWDSSDDGMQDSRGHRKAIMSIDGEYTNVGIAMVPENDPGTGVGPLVTTGNYAYANMNAANHYNRFIVGTVWQDLDGDGKYDPGEGFNNIQVTVSPGKYFAVTGVGGGYAIPVLEPGTYTIRFSGAATGEQQVVVGDASVLVDRKVASGSAAPTASQNEAELFSGTPLAPPPGIRE